MNRVKNKKLSKRKHIQPSSKKGTGPPGDSFFRIKCGPGFGVIPDYIIVPFTFADAAYVRFFANPYGYWRYRTNAPNDFDPILGTTATSAFLEWIALLPYSIVLDFEAEHTVTNLEAFPVILSWAPSIIDLNLSIVSPTLATNIAETCRPISGAHTLSASGGLDTFTFKRRVNLPEFYGDKTYYHGSGNFIGLGTANPAISMFWGLIIVSTTGLALTKGVAQSTKLTARTKLFHKNTLFS